MTRSAWFSTARVFAICLLAGCGSAGESTEVGRDDTPQGVTSGGSCASGSTDFHCASYWNGVLARIDISKGPGKALAGQDIYKNVRALTDRVPTEYRALRAWSKLAARLQRPDHVALGFDAAQIKLLKFNLSQAAAALTRADHAGGSALDSTYRSAAVTSFVQDPEGLAILQTFNQLPANPYSSYANFAAGLNTMAALAAPSGPKACVGFCLKIGKYFNNDPRRTAAFLYFYLYYFQNYDAHYGASWDRLGEPALRQRLASYGITKGSVGVANLDWWKKHRGMTRAERHFRLDLALNPKRTRAVDLLSYLNRVALDVPPDLQPTPIQAPPIGTTGVPVTTSAQAGVPNVIVVNSSLPGLTVTPFTPAQIQTIQQTVNDLVAIDPVGMGLIAASGRPVYIVQQTNLSESRFQITNDMFIINLYTAGNITYFGVNGGQTGWYTVSLGEALAHEMAHVQRTMLTSISSVDAIAQAFHLDEAISARMVEEGEANVDFNGSEELAVADENNYLAAKGLPLRAGYGSAIDVGDFLKTKDVAALEEHKANVARLATLNFADVSGTLARYTSRLNEHYSSVYPQELYLNIHFGNGSSLSISGSLNPLVDRLDFLRGLASLETANGMLVSVSVNNAAMGRQSGIDVEGFPTGLSW